MVRLFLIGLLAHVRAARGLYALTVLGVALGVGSVLAIQIINQNAVAAFAGSVRAVSGDADLSLVGSAGSIPEARYIDVLGTPGVSAARPIVRVDVALDDGDGFLEVAGIDLLRPTETPWVEVPDDFATVVTSPGWIAVTPGFAVEQGLAVGDTLAVSIGLRQASLVVGALVDFRRTSPLATSRLAVMDIAQAQALLGTPGELQQIDVVAQEGTQTDELRTVLLRRLGPGVEVLSPGDIAENAGALLRAFRVNLTALSLVSLFVGVFLVYSSTQASLFRRRGEFGLLRAVGASRAQIVTLVLGEAAVLGLLGVVLGLPVGFWTAVANIDVVSATLTNVYLLDAVERVVLPWWSVPLALAVGVGGACTGVLLPLLDLLRRNPKDLLSAYRVHERAARRALPSFLVGTLIIVGTGAWYGFLGRGWQPAGFVLGLGLLAGLPLLAPLILERLASRVPVVRFGLAYSVRSLATGLQATSVAVAALAVAIAMMVAITSMVGSFRETLAVWIERTVPADIYISPESWRGDQASASLDREFVAEIAARRDVAEVDQLRRITTSVEGRRAFASGVEMALSSAGRRFSFLAGDPAGAVAALRAGRGVLVSEPLARRVGVDVGDTIRVATGSGAVAFPVAGVHYDYAADAGSVVMSRARMRRAFGPGETNSVALYLSPGTDVEAVAAALSDRYRELPVRIRSNAALRREVFAIFDQTFAITHVLQAMSLLIAISGITLTLLVLARERISETALFSALGATRRQVFVSFLGKGLGIGAVGLLLGLGGGVVLTLVLVFVVNRAYFGWTIQLTWPAWTVLGQSASILAAAVLASVYPAARASRAPATALTREDV